MTLKHDAQQTLLLMDLTSLNEDDTEQSILALLDSIQPELGLPAAICVYPQFVKQVRQELTQRGWMSVNVATVTNFYEGEQALATVLAETKQALLDGANEIDLVLPYKEVKAGIFENAQQLVVRSKQLCTEHHACLKVIIESGELKDPNLIKFATELAIDAGADFVKTSTGKVSVNATLEAAEVMLEVIKTSGKSIGFKAAGGVKTVSDASAYLRLVEDKYEIDTVTAQQFRFGASGLLKDVYYILNS